MLSRGIDLGLQQQDSARREQTPEIREQGHRVRARAQRVTAEGKVELLRASLDAAVAGHLEQPGAIQVGGELSQQQVLCHERGTAPKRLAQGIAIGF